MADFGRLVPNLLFRNRDAHAISGYLTGTVLDASGAGIPNATIAALNDATGVKATTQSNSTGVYRFTNLPVGRYTLTTTAAGFTTDQLKNVDLTLNTVVTANITMAVGTVGYFRGGECQRRLH